MLRFGTQRLAIAVGLALMALLPTTAFAASTATESISGVEIGFPIACGPSGSGDSLSTFSGGASGTISGVWSASVCHTGDRKSTRLNSSHRCISYAVFCLKKKKKDEAMT